MMTLLNWSDGMTNEEKLKRIEELEHTIHSANLEIVELKNSIRYQYDITGKCYRNNNRENLLLQVVNGKDRESCLVLKYEIQDNVYDGSITPRNNEFHMEVSLSWMSKRLIEFHWKEIEKEELADNKQKIIHYIAEHFSK